MFKVLGNDHIDLKIKHRVFNEFLIFAVKNPTYLKDIDKAIPYFDNDKEINVAKEVAKFFWKKNDLENATKYFEKGIKRNSNDLEAMELNLEVLLEIHTEEELEHFNSEIDLVGINNRNLKDFKVDLQHSVNLKNLLPKGTLSVAESGIYNVEDFKFLKEKGFDAFLMGEYFMKTDNPGKTFEEFSKLI